MTRSSYSSTTRAAVLDVPVAYHGGGQYPHLVRDNSKPDLLGQTIAPRSSEP